MASWVSWTEGVEWERESSIVVFPSCGTWRMVVGGLAIWMPGADGPGDGPGDGLGDGPEDGPGWCLENGEVALEGSSWTIARVGLPTALISRMVWSNKPRTTELFSSKLSVVS